MHGYLWLRRLQIFSLITADDSNKETRKMVRMDYLFTKDVGETMYSSVEALSLITPSIMGYNVEDSYYAN